MASFSSGYMITDGVTMTEEALGLRYFHPSCFHPFLDSSSYLVWTLKCSGMFVPRFQEKIKFPKMSADVKKSIRHESI